ncbi:hypothetical protein RQP46_010012 [Phenoliferia psychrophenolica]
MNPFRQSSFSSLDVRSAPPLSPASPAHPSSNGQSLHPQRQQGPRMSVDTSRGSWDDLGVPLATSPTSLRSPPLPSPATPDLAPPDRSRLFGRAKTASSVSLPLPATEDETPKKGRWTLGRGGGGAPKAARTASSSVASWNTQQHADEQAAKDRAAEDTGFVVRSFRQVTRVQEDPISTGPYESHPLPNSPPLPPVPLYTPATPNPHHKPSSPYSTRPPLNVRASTSSAERDQRSSSPTISAEQFRLASARSRSTTSLISVGGGGSSVVGEPTPERPKFEPTRSRQSSGAQSLSSHSQVTDSPLAPPRPMFAGPSRSHSRESSSNSHHSHRDDDRSETLAHRSSSESPRNRDSKLLPEIANWDDDLKLIALYGTGDRRSASSSTSQQPPSPPAATRSSAATSTPAPLPNQNHMRAPSLAFEPPTPTTSNGSSTPNNSATRPSLAASARGSPPSPSNRRKGKAPMTWNDSSDESDSDDDGDDEDDVPLARLPAARASMSNLSLHSASAASPMKARRRSSEVEVLSTNESGVPPVPQSVSNFRHSRADSWNETHSLLDRARSNEPERRNSQRRSMSTFSLATTHASVPSLSSLPGTPGAPQLGNRTYSSPPTPDADVFNRNAFSATDLPLLPASSNARSSSISTASPPQNFSSSSSGSGSSAPTTPRDSSPHQSILNGKSGGAFAQQVKFDVSSLNNDAERKWKSRLSVGHSLAPSSTTAPSSRPPAGLSSGRSSSSIGFASTDRLQSAFSADAMRPSSQYAYNQQRMSSAPAAVQPKQQKGDVFDRMKARHKADTIQAEKIGRDLNGPGGRVHDSEEEDEDDDVPLTALSGRSQSRAGSAYGGYEGQGQQGFFPAPSSLGGYSQLSSAPPGVDPYLYASLPPDQKMSLHQRSQQMMQMMAQAAYQAKAESTAGWETGSQLSGSASVVGGQGGQHDHHQQQQQQQHHQQRQSMGPAPPMMAFGSPMMGFPGGPGGGFGMPPMHPMQMQMQMPMGMPYGFGYGAPMGPMPGSRLPPFAPSMADSRQFFQQNQQQANYAGSAIGFSPYQSSGHLPPPGLQRRAPASTIGIGRR